MKKIILLILVLVPLSMLMLGVLPITIVTTSRTHYPSQSIQRCATNISTDYMDRTLLVFSNETITLEPTDDTFVNPDQPWRNFGYGDYLWVGDRMTFLKFNLSSIPSYAEVISAELRLCLDENLAGEDIIAESFLYSNNSWTENDLTWDNVDWNAISSSPSDNATLFYGETWTWKNWNVTNYIRNALSENVSIALKSNFSGSGGLFSSKDRLSGIYSPRLIINYTTSIQKAINLAQPGDTVFVHSGAYYENVVVNKSLSLIGENMENVTIDARGIGNALRIEADNVTVSNFTIRYGDNGIYLSGSHGSTIRNNNVTTNILRGILGMYSTGNNFEGNIVNNHWQAGIDLAEGSIDNIIQDNIITDNGVGIYLCYNNGNNTVQGNKVQNNSRGINVGFSNNNTIISNIITSSGDYGILFESSSGNDVCGNLIANNQVAGIKLAGGNDNKIYHNNFIDNADQVLISLSFNVWDDGYPSGGNYWDDYGELDTDGDGIGDMPYVIDANNQDRYPLVVPLGPIPIVWNGMIYPVELKSNSTISRFQFKASQKMISFNVTGPDDTLGFCNITIPNSLIQDLWQGNYTVLVDGKQPLTVYDWTDGTYTYMYFTYFHSEHKVDIIPEFPTWTSMILILIVLTVAIAIYKRRLLKTQIH